jgi:hypothetical protein
MQFGPALFVLALVASPPTKPRAEAKPQRPDASAADAKPPAPSVYSAK